MLTQNSVPNYPSISFQKRLFQKRNSLRVNNRNNKNIYDEDFVSLINTLNESIKEYYKVSRNNIVEANSFISFYEQQGKKLQLLTDEIPNSNSYERINEILEQIPKINEIMSQLKMNTNSNEKNLILFFEDAKVLFKKMKTKREQKLIEINSSNRNHNLSREINNSHGNSYTSNNVKPLTNILNNIIKPEQKEIKRINTYDSSSLFPINNIYSKIMILINNLNEFNYMLSKISLEASNKYKILQNNIKKELEILINLEKKNDFKSNITNENIRCKTSPGKKNQENERLKKINAFNEKKIIQLNNQISNYKKNIIDISELNKIKSESESIIQNLQMKNNDLNLKLIEAGKEIKEKNNIINEYQKNFSNNRLKLNNNTNVNLNNKSKPTENQIINLQHQLLIYKNNESALNNLINEYKAQISKIRSNYNSLSKIILNKNKEIEQLKLEVNNKRTSNNSKKKEDPIQINNNKIINNYKNNNKGIHSKINSGKENNQTTIRDLMNIIAQLKKEINNYKRKEIERESTNNKYIKQINDMNNNILFTNKLIEQKDELIKKLNEENNNYNNKNYLDLEKERDDYKFQFEQMKKKYLNIKEILENKKTNLNPQQDNLDILKIKLNDMQLENEKLLKEIKEIKEDNLNQNIIQNDNGLNNNTKELTLENSKLKESLSKAKENISKLESDIKKKDDELEGLRAFIFKLQSKIEKTEENNRNDYSPIINSKEQGNNNIIINKLNNAEKKIKMLQDKNKELTYKLEEKQERDFSGYRTEDNNFSNYEEEFDLKKMVVGSKEKNRSEDINIDYPGVQGLKEKFKENERRFVLLEEQVKILISNINFNNKIKPQITQICQIMNIPPDKIQLIILGKDKKKLLGVDS